MEVAANLTIGVVGLIATLASTYFGYVGVRGQIRRRRRVEQLGKTSEWTLTEGDVGQGGRGERVRDAARPWSRSF